MPPAAGDQSFPSAHAIKTAVQHHTAGRLAEAEAIYRQVLSVDAKNFDALHLLGVLRHQRGDNVEAAGLISRAVATDPTDAPAQFNLGNVYAALGQSDEAIRCYRQAIALKPDYLDPQFNLANALQRLGRLDEALASYEKVISLKPDFVPAHFGAGVVFGERRDWADAIASFQQAVSLDAGFAEGYSSLGQALIGLGDLDQAVDACRKALSLNPKLADAHFTLGNALRKQGKPDAALASYRNAVALNPDLVDAHNNAGIAYSELGRFEESIRSFRSALSAKPDAAETHYNLGHAYSRQGELAEALLCYRNALSLKPDFAEARWALTMAQIPLFYATEAEIPNSREAFSRELAGLTSWFAADPERIAKGFDAVGTHQPFYLAYHEENNRELLSRYGDLCTRLMKASQEQAASNAPAGAERRKIALGIVSANFCTHSVWQAIIKGLLLQIDRSRFELHLFSLGAAQDEETAFAKAQAARFVTGARDLRGWIQAIRESHVDALIYPEIGMDPMTTKLASMRLAPVQVMTWGHPQTSGLPTIDYFLSAEDFEPVMDERAKPSAQEHYTERLVTLPHLGCSYPALEVAAADPNFTGVDIRKDQALLLCPGAPFKYLPQHDRIFVEIARRLGECRILFVNGARLESLSAKLRVRLEQAFSRAGMAFGKHVAFLPWQQRSEFYGLMKRVDVFLDTIGFSGFNTAMQAIECGLPIVTLDGSFMRGRLGSGILKRMGMAELVAESDEEYVALAVRLARDRDYNRDVRRRIAADRHVLFNDVAPIRGLEDFLVRVTRRT